MVWGPHPRFTGSEFFFVQSIITEQNPGMRSLFQGEAVQQMLQPDDDTQFDVWLQCFLALLVFPPIILV